jgi:hypothetical protein
MTIGLAKRDVAASVEGLNGYCRGRRLSRAGPGCVPIDQSREIMLRSTP